jgi:hypothetical protein
LQKVIKQGIPTVRKTAQNYDSLGLRFENEIDRPVTGTYSKLSVVDMLITRIKLEWGDNATTLQRAIEYYNWKPPSRGWSETGANARKAAIARAKADSSEVYKIIDREGGTPLASKAHIIKVDTDIFKVDEVEELAERLDQLRADVKSGKRNEELLHAVRLLVEPAAVAREQEEKMREEEAAEAALGVFSPMHEPPHGGRRKSTRRSRRRRRHRSTRSRRKRTSRR